MLLAFDFTSGRTERQIEPVEGSDTVIFTAPEEEGNVIIGVSGTTADGAPFDDKLTFSIILPPTAMPSCEFTSVPIAPPQLKLSNLEGTIDVPARCENELPVGTAIEATGTASNIPDNSYPWLLALARNGLYYPQCNDTLKGLCGANYDSRAGTWAIPIYLGDRAYPKCKERYYLVLVTLDSKGNDSLTDEMLRQAQEKKYAIAPDDLPKNIEELARVEVETAGSTNSCP